MELQPKEWQLRLEVCKFVYRRVETESPKRALEDWVYLNGVLSASLCIYDYRYKSVYRYLHARTCVHMYI